jgi:hypothetical protein
MFLRGGNKYDTVATVYLSVSIFRIYYCVTSTARVTSTIHCISSCTSNCIGVFHMVESAPYVLAR